MRSRMKVTSFCTISLLVIVVVFIIVVHLNTSWLESAHIYLTNENYISKDVDHLTNFLPPLYVITPTYRRPQQIAELMRLSHTLMHVTNLHWLVIEDSPVKSLQVNKLLIRSNLSFSHLIAPMPPKCKGNTCKFRPERVSNRNRGLEWLRKNAIDGVFYFADDDKTYDLDLFEEMRSTERVSMWPVGLCSGYGLSTPIVRDGNVVGFYDGRIARRKFPVDMAGFAVSVYFLLQRPKAKMSYKPGFEGNKFLMSLAPFEVEDIEPKADNCTKILAWKTKSRWQLPATKIDPEKYKDTNLIHLSDLIY